MIFGKKLYELRTKSGMSQNRIARILNVSYQAVSKWENGQSLPDIELLMPLAGLFGISVEYLLSDNMSLEDDSIKRDIVDTNDIKDNNARLISELNQYLTHEDALTALKMMESGELKIDVNLEVKKLTESKAETENKTIPAGQLKIDTISEFSEPFARLIIKALNKTDYILKDLVLILRCPWCKENLKLIKDNDGENSLECKNKHKFRIINGVIDFGSSEDEGNSWSEIFRTYEDYIRVMKNPKRNPDDFNIENSKFFKSVFDKLSKIKPKVILEVGCGVAGSAELLLRYINWPCIYILNDLSFRALEYDKKFFEDNVYNPYVKLIYMACDARMMPIKDDVLDCVCSYGGYENVMENMIDAIKESYRILKNDQKCIYGMCIVKDLKNKSVQKWIELLKNTGWGKMDYTIAKIQNKAYWFDINRDVGFKDCKIIELSEEMQAPDADVFPYENEILRWMGEAVIVSTK